MTETRIRFKGEWKYRIDEACGSWSLDCWDVDGQQYGCTKTFNSLEAADREMKDLIQRNGSEGVMYQLPKHWQMISTPQPPAAETRPSTFDLPA